MGILGRFGNVQEVINNSIGQIANGWGGKSTQFNTLHS